MLSNQTLSPFFLFYGIATLFLEIIYSLVTSAKREAIFFLFGCSEVNSTWLITSELANQRARKTLFTCVVYTKNYYDRRMVKHWIHYDSRIAVDNKRLPNSRRSQATVEVCFYIIVEFLAADFAGSSAIFCGHVELNLSWETQEQS